MIRKDCILFYYDVKLETYIMLKICRYKKGIFNKEQ